MATSNGNTKQCAIAVEKKGDFCASPPFGWHLDCGGFLVPSRMFSAEESTQFCEGEYHQYYCGGVPTVLWSIFNIVEGNHKHCGDDTRFFFIKNLL